jgi:coenzyme PQQ synthesis protein D (PqqD)
MASARKVRAVAEPRFVRSGDHPHRRLGSDTILLDLDHGRYFSLDAIGAQVWSALRTPQTLDGLTRRFVRTFDVAPTKCRRDLRRFLTRLEREGLVRRSDP